MDRQSKESISFTFLPMAVWSSLTVRVIGIDLYNKGRMTGDCHVRFCERGKVKFLPPTRLVKRYRQAKDANTALLKIRYTQI
jgi:hypothetical protein